MPFIVHHFKEGAHLLALQEVNTRVDELQGIMARTFPGSVVMGYTNGASNGSILVVHPSLAPFVRPLTSPELGTLGNVHDCVAAATIALPKEPIFHVFSLYISGYDSRARDKVARAITPWLNTPALFLGDMNHVQSQVLDSHNQGHMANWPWLRTQLTPEATTPPTLVDFFRVKHPLDTSLTRPQDTVDGRTKGSRIDYIFGTTKVRHWLPSTQISILQNRMGSDHRPVELVKAIQPFTPPHNVINAVLRISEFTDDQLKKFHDTLQPIANFASLLPPHMADQSNKQVIEDAELIFDCLEIAARKVTGQGTHYKKPSAKEKELDKLIRDTSNDSFRAKAEQLTKELAEEAQAKATKRMHAALVKGVGMKKAIMNFNNNVSPPVALISTTGEVADSPQQNCAIMSDTLLSLGGEVEYQVPEEVEHDFLREIKHAPPNNDFSPPTWEQFQSIIRKPKPQKAVGLDNLNLYLLSVCPESIQHYIFSLVIRLWNVELPPKWLEAEIFLLPKGGDPMDPTNYRPIALLGSIYKIFSTHASHYLYSHLANPDALHQSQFGFRQKHQTIDHVVALACKRSKYPDSYILYLDLSKAFNSVVLETLFKVLKKNGLPSSFTDFLLRLYHSPLDTPRVNGQRLASHLQFRGLRQGCPLSPGLFALYIDPLLHKLSRAIHGDATASLHAFADDLAIHSTHLSTLTKALKVMITEAKPYGLIINMKKSELHAWGNAPQATLTFLHQGVRHRLSSLDKEGRPHKYYKYLGVFFFTDYSAHVMKDHFLSIIDSYFSSLPNMLFSPKEAVRLINSQLIPKLAYRMTMHCLSFEVVDLLQKRIWYHMSRISKLPKITPTKARYGPTKEGALGLFELSTRIATLTLTQFQRALHGESPQLVTTLLKQALGIPIPESDHRYSIAKCYVQAAEALDCQVFGLSKQPHINRFLLPRHPVPPALPTDNLVHKSTEAGVQGFSYLVSPDEPMYGDLVVHGCQTAADLLRDHPNAWRAYTDGSGLHISHNGAAVVLVDPSDPGARVFSHRIREDSSYPAELYALLLALKKAPRDKELVLLSDCSAALQKLHSIVHNTCIYYSHTHSYILRQIKKMLLLRTAPTYYAHIRSHVGFAGNEWADIFAKHAAFCSFPPPQIGQI